MYHIVIKLKVQTKFLVDIILSAEISMVKTYSKITNCSSSGSQIKVSCRDIIKVLNKRIVLVRIT
ncbi:hypothetical protein C2G38_2058194 [Gigaspora rosea]|uniref:Uncharacterized protein n=1 Tax=Gigaspora rosea TaxID=44941 RepID=A0A397WAV8_9GLOM|nr:hypothetical protein C2G38_2058194 [Gigaspora rosea]